MGGRKTPLMERNGRPAYSVRAYRKVALKQTTRSLLFMRTLSLDYLKKTWLFVKL